MAAVPRSGHQPGQQREDVHLRPDGRISNLCISEPDQGAALALRFCNGSRWQAFTAKQVDGTSFCERVNAATGDVVSADGIRSHLAGISPPTDPGPGVEWTLAA